MGERREREPVNEVDSHVAKKYEIRRRIGKGVSEAVFIIHAQKMRKMGNRLIAPDSHATQTSS